MDYLKLLKSLNVNLLKNGFLENITGITMDSRKVQENGCFVAIYGLTVDGHNYIDKAYEKGARVFVIERDVDVCYDNVTVLRVSSSRKALAEIGKQLYNNIDEKVNLIGITGTNGKTSTSYYISHIYNFYKNKAITIGTLGVKLGENDIDLPITASTTPEFMQLLDIINYSDKNNIKNIVMEVSSHSLTLDKVYGLNFEVGVYTNLTQDHLDFHVTMENYLEAKCILFEQSKVAVVNLDDKHSDEILKYCNNEIITYSIEKNSDYRASNIILGDTFVEFDLQNQHFKINVPGKFTVYNLLGAIITVLKTTNLTLQEISVALESCKGVPGRVQTITSTHGFSIIVDYAHTPDALEKVINTVRETTTGKIITIFGCGGERDSIKRPIMGKIATSLSDIAIITSDNPRHENPITIIDDIKNGVQENDMSKIIILVDRLEAISKAIDLAEKGDKIIIAGKGHEDYQIINDDKKYFDDLKIAEKLLEDKN